MSLNDVANAPDVVVTEMTTNSGHLPAKEPATTVGGDDQDDLWIDKVKEVVAKTSTDPFLESQEFAKVKAAYLSNKYNRDSKLSEDSA